MPPAAGRPVAISAARIDAPSSPLPLTWSLCQDAEEFDSSRVRGPCRLRWPASGLRAAEPRAFGGPVMAEKTLLFEVKDRIATITLNRPERLNAINRELREELRAAWERVKTDPEVWCAIVTGAGESLVERCRRRVARLGRLQAAGPLARARHPGAYPPPAVPTPHGSAQAGHRRGERHRRRAWRSTS